MGEGREAAEGSVSGVWQFRPCKRENRPGLGRGRCVVEVNSSSSLKFRQELGFPGGSDGEESTCNVGDLGSIPGLGRSPGEGKGHLL